MAEINIKVTTSGPLNLTISLDPREAKTARSRKAWLDNYGDDELDDEDDDIPEVTSAFPWNPKEVL